MAILVMTELALYHQVETDSLKYLYQFLGILNEDEDSYIAENGEEFEFEVVLGGGNLLVNSDPEEVGNSEDDDSLLDFIPSDIDTEEFGNNDGNSEDEDSP